jgi:hypothetical protein
MSKEGGLAFGGFLILVLFFGVLFIADWFLGKKERPQNLVPKPAVVVTKTNVFF